MSEKAAATFHGADIITRLRAYGPHSDYEGLMREAADELERLDGLYEFYRGHYKEAVRTINAEADLHAHCDVSQASDE